MRGRSAASDKLRIHTASSVWERLECFSTCMDRLCSSSAYLASPAARRRRRLAVQRFKPRFTLTSVSLLLKCEASFRPHMMWKLNGKSTKYFLHYSRRHGEVIKINVLLQQHHVTDMFSFIHFVEKVQQNHQIQKTLFITSSITGFPVISVTGFLI